ncbi:hypothetical protein CFD26_100687 [Aspergillus turcosus]|uniref:Uncharacterized protein n=1 Tax=Aspergillus turcosus TaxID=1245748 RepID=A0A421CWR4_9EURO|nr:hypothetical protein CFD26_100687 [Aspergillus turcosus]
MASSAVSQPSIPYRPKMSNAIPVDSPAETRNRVISFLLTAKPEISSGDKRGYTPAVWMKHPDDMIYFDEFGGTEQFLQTVVEIGFSESYYDLVRDASNGYSGLVVSLN